jgi:hypothetical protein
MNYLFTFDSFIDVFLLADFEMFCQELDVVTVTSSANEDEQLFPPNYIIVYADTEDQDLLESISYKYQQLISESGLVDKPIDFRGQALQ